MIVAWVDFRVWKLLGGMALRSNPSGCPANIMIMMPKPKLNICVAV